jgi:hypothetical protein
MQLELPMAELIAGACDSIEALCGQIGLFGRGKSEG